MRLSEIVETLLTERYPDADVAILAGSAARGEATSTSDLDLVMIFDHLEAAFRESFVFRDWPVEVFAQDPQTLEYFFALDRAAGAPSVAFMIDEGIAIPRESELCRRVKGLTRAFLEKGPDPWDAKRVELSRYSITCLADDLKGSDRREETIATGASMYRAICDHYCRTRRIWSAVEKQIPRYLGKIDSEFAERFSSAFEALFSRDDIGDVVDVAEEVLKPEGGWLFDGYRNVAPAQWRGLPPE